MSLSEDLKKETIRKLNQKLENISYLKGEILLSDAEKETWDNGIVSLDTNLLEKINEVNQTLYEVRDAYQNRIDSGCYSDLFWRIESGGFGLYNLIVDQLTLVGYGTTVAYVDGAGGIATYAPNNKSGYEEDNLHALVYKNHPYLQDNIDTTGVSFIGQIGLGSSTLTIISNDDTGIRSDLSIGNFIIPSKQNIFSSNSNTIIGFGTTIFVSDEIESITGIATTSILTTTIILENFSIGSASVPESDGSYVTFTSVIDPEELMKIDPRYEYSVPFTQNPFSPESIGILTTGNVGIGYTIKYDNTGNPRNTQSWKPEFEGVKIDKNIITEPIVGSGKVYYKIGFSRYPVDSSGNPALKGDRRTVLLLPGTVLYNNTPSCSVSIASSITNAIVKRDTMELALANNIDNFNTLLDTSNYLRKERNEYALRIWTLRQSIGGENEDAEKYGKINNYLGISTVIGVLG